MKPRGLPSKWLDQGQGSAVYEGESKKLPCLLKESIKNQAGRDMEKPFSPSLREGDLPDDPSRSVNCAVQS